MTIKNKSNGKYIIDPNLMDSFDWDIWLREKMGPKYETLEEEDKKAEVHEDLFEEYLRLLKAGELLPNTSFERFERIIMILIQILFLKLKKEFETKTDWKALLVYLLDRKVMHDKQTNKRRKTPFALSQAVRAG